MVEIQDYYWHDVHNGAALNDLLIDHPTIDLFLIYVSLIEGIIKTNKQLFTRSLMGAATTNS